MNITDAIWRTMQQGPERTALVYQQKSISYASLRVHAEKLMARLSALGVAPGHCVALHSNDPVTHLSLILALARMGAISTPLNPSWPRDLKSDLLRRNKPLAWLRDQDEWTSDALPAERQIAIATLFAGLGEEAPVRPTSGADRGDQPWRLPLSSGTTGVQKSIVWTHRSGSLLLLLSMAVYDCRPGGRLLVHADLGIGLALGHTLMQLCGGGTVVLPADARPETVLELLQSAQPTSMLTTTALAGGLVACLEARPASDAGLQATSLRSITLGGSVVPPSLARALHQHLCPRLLVTYGSTETGTLALAELGSDGSDSASSGRLLPWVEAEAADEHGNSLPAGQTGLLRFRSPAMATSYLDDPEANVRAFRSGWYYPGDLGSVDERGRLFLGGRADQRINLQGVKIDPRMIEQVLTSHPAVVDAGVVGIPDEKGMLALVAVVVVRDNAQMEDLLQMCQTRFGAQSSPRQLVVTRQLPQNLMGKLDRDALTAQITAYFKAKVQSPGNSASPA